MALKLSTGFVNTVTGFLSSQNALAGYVIDIYSGSMPTTPDSAASGTRLVTITNNSSAYTPETAASTAITLSGTSGSLDTLTVNAIEILGTPILFDVSLSVTASAVAAQINNNPQNLLFKASPTGGVVTITCLNGLGDLPNGWVTAATVTSDLTVAAGNMAGGVSSLNGLHFGPPTDGVISKLLTENWSGDAVSGGTASWFRIRGSGDDGVSASTTAVRVDGVVAVTNADMNLGSLTVTLGAPFIIPSGSMTQPKS